MKLKGKKILFVEWIEGAKGRETSWGTHAGFLAKLGMGGSQQAYNRYLHALNTSHNYDWTQRLTNFFGGIGFMLRKKPVVIGNFGYLIFLLLMGISGFSAFPHEILYALAGIALFAQAIVTTGLMQYILERPFFNALFGFGSIFFLMSPYFMAQVFTYSYGAGIAMMAVAAYVATGRGFGLEHTKLGDILKSYTKSHILNGVLGTTIGLLGIAVWFNLTLWFSLPFVLMMIFGMVMPFYANKGSFPIFGVTLSKWMELLKSDFDSGRKFIKEVFTKESKMDGIMYTISFIVWIFTVPLLPLTLSLLIFAFVKGITLSNVIWPLGFGIIGIFILPVVMNLLWRIFAGNFRKINRIILLESAAKDLLQNPDVLNKLHLAMQQNNYIVVINDQVWDVRLDKSVKDALLRMYANDETKAKQELFRAMVEVNKANQEKVVNGQLKPILDNLPKNQALLNILLHARQNEDYVPLWIYFDDNMLKQALLNLQKWNESKAQEALFKMIDKKNEDNQKKIVNKELGSVVEELLRDFSVLEDLRQARQQRDHTIVITSVRWNSLSNSLSYALLYLAKNSKAAAEKKLFTELENMRTEMVSTQAFEIMDSHINRRKQELKDSLRQYFEEQDENLRMTKRDAMVKTLKTGISVNEVNVLLDAYGNQQRVDKVLWYEIITSVRLSSSPIMTSQQPRSPPQGVGDKTASIFKNIFKSHHIFIISLALAAIALFVSSAFAQTEVIAQIASTISITLQFLSSHLGIFWTGVGILALGLAIILYFAIWRIFSLMSWFNYGNELKALYRKAEDSNLEIDLLRQQIDNLQEIFSNNFEGLKAVIGFELKMVGNKIIYKEEVIKTSADVYITSGEGGYHYQDSGEPVEPEFLSNIESGEVVEIYQFADPWQNYDVIRIGSVSSESHFVQHSKASLYLVEEGINLHSLSSLPLDQLREELKNILDDVDKGPKGSVRESSSPLGAIEVARQSINKLFTGIWRFISATSWYQRRVVKKALGKIRNNLPIDLDIGEDKDAQIPNWPTITPEVLKSASLTDETKILILIPSLVNGLYEGVYKEELALLYGLAYVRQIADEAVRAGVIEELSSLGYGATAGFIKGHLDDDLPTAVKAVTTEEEEVLRMIRLRDRVVSTTRAIRIAQELTGVDKGVFGKILNDQGLLEVLFGVRMIARLQQEYSEEEMRRIKEIFWALRQVEGVAVHMMKAQGKLYAYNEYAMKDQAADVDQDTAHTKEGVESLIRRQIAKGEGILYEAIQEEVAGDVNIRVMRKVAERVLMKATDKRFIEFDEANLLYRSGGLGEKVFEIERAPVYMTFIATMNRPEALKAQLEPEFENWSIFNRRSRLTVLDFSRDEIFAANTETLDNLSERYGIRIRQISRAERNKEVAGWMKTMSTKLQAELNGGRMDEVVKGVLTRRGVLTGGRVDKDKLGEYAMKNIFFHISGVRNYTVLKGAGYPVIMNIDDDAPPETYVLLPERREALRAQRANEKGRRVDGMLREAGEVLGRLIRSEDDLYEAAAEQENERELLALFKKYFAYSQDGRTGLIPQATGEIVRLSERYVDQELKITHQRYEGLMTPLPEYMVAMSDFVYPRPRVEKKDRQFQVLPVNIAAGARLVGMNAGETQLPVMGQNLRTTMAEPVSEQKKAQIKKKRITNVPFTFILDQDTSAIAQYLRYLEAGRKTSENLQHTDQAALIVEGVGGFVADTYVIFNRQALDNKVPSPSIGRALRLEEPPYVVWVKAPMENDQITVAVAPVGGGQERSIEEREYIMGFQDYTEVVGVIARPFYEKSVALFYEELAGDGALQAEGQRFDRLRMLGKKYIEVAKGFQLSGEDRTKVIKERAVRARLMNRLGLQRAGKENPVNQEASTQEIRDMDLTLVQYAENFNMYHPARTKQINKNNEGDDHGPADKHDYFYAIKVEGGVIKWRKVVPKIKVELIEGKTIIGAVESLWKVIKGEGAIKVSWWRPVEPLKLEEGRSLVMEALPEEGVEIIVAAIDERFTEELMERVRHEVQDQIMSDGELILLWPNVLGVVRTNSGSSPMKRQEEVILNANMGTGEFVYEDLLVKYEVDQKVNVLRNLSVTDRAGNILVEGINGIPSIHIKHHKLYPEAIMFEIELVNGYGFLVVFHPVNQEKATFFMRTRLDDAQQRPFNSMDIIMHVNFKFDEQGSLYIVLTDRINNIITLGDGGLETIKQADGTVQHFARFQGAEFDVTLPVKVVNAQGRVIKAFTYDEDNYLKEAEGVSLYFDSHSAIDGIVERIVDLDVPVKVVAVSGRAGAGKSVIDEHLGTALEQRGEGPVITLPSSRFILNEAARSDPGSGLLFYDQFRKDVVGDIRDLKEGRTVYLPVFDYVKRVWIVYPEEKLQALKERENVIIAKEKRLLPSPRDDPDVVKQFKAIYHRELTAKDLFINEETGIIYERLTVERGVIILDGAVSLIHPEIAQLADVKVFLDIAAAMRILRMLFRAQTTGRPFNIQSALQRRIAFQHYFDRSLVEAQIVINTSKTKREEFLTFLKTIAETGDQIQKSYLSAILKFIPGDWAEEIRQLISQQPSSGQNKASSPIIDARAVTESLGVLLGISDEGMDEEGLVKALLWDKGRVESGMVGIKSVFARKIEHFMNVSDILESMRSPADLLESHRELVVQFLARVAVGLTREYNKPLAEVTQEEFNRLFGRVQVTTYGGLGSRNSPYGIEQKTVQYNAKEEAILRIVINSSYNTPGMPVVLSVGKAAVRKIVKLEYRDQAVALNNSPDGGIMSREWIDEDKWTKIFPQEVVLWTGSMPGYGGMFTGAMDAVARETNLMSKARYVQLMLGELATLADPSKSNSNFIAYITAVANDYAVTMGLRKDNVVTIKGNAVYYGEDGAFKALTDWRKMHVIYREDRERKDILMRLLKVEDERNAELLARLNQWEELEKTPPKVGAKKEDGSLYERDQLAQEIEELPADRKNKIYINANTAVFRTDMLKDISGFVAKVRKKDHVFLSKYVTINDKTKTPEYAPWDLVGYVGNRLGARGRMGVADTAGGVKGYGQAE